MKKKLLSILLFAFVALTNAQNSVSEATNASTPGILTVNVTTKQGNLGGYSPSNIMAIWIVDSNGTFVKTLLAQAATRKSDLYKWKTATSTYNVVDATTGATQSSYGARTCVWNATNVSKIVVADGNYTVWMEVTDDAVHGPLTSYTFTKGTTTINLTPTALTNFANISISWVPTATGIDAVKLTNLYSVYPNPTKSSIYVNGSDVQQVEIFTLAGKSILKTNQQNINLSLLARGSYLAQITTAKGNFVKKIIKE
ncbi:MAG TPA: DUF2271 domain-containing protein [Paludibacter sp.]